MIYNLLYNRHTLSPWSPWYFNFYLDPCEHGEKVFCAPLWIACSWSCSVYWLNLSCCELNIPLKSLTLSPSVVWRIGSRQTYLHYCICFDSSVQNISELCSQFIFSCCCHLKRCTQSLCNQSLSLYVCNKGLRQEVKPYLQGARGSLVDSKCSQRLTAHKTASFCEVCCVAGVRHF